MKKIFVLIVVSLFSTALTAFAQQEINSSLNEIKSINVEGEIIVKLVVGDEHRLEGTISNEQIKNFTWSVVDGTNLILTYKKSLNLDGKTTANPVKVTLHVASLNSIKCKKGASIIADKAIDVKEIKIDATRNSIVSIPVKCFDLTIDASTGAKVNIRGESQFSVVSSSYGATINTKELICESVTATATTDSECVVQATKKLLLTAKIGGLIKYKKSTATVNQSANTLGKIETFE